MLIGEAIRHDCHVIYTPLIPGMLQAEEAKASDLMVVTGCVEFGASEMAGFLSAGEVLVVPGEARPADLWPQVWGLCDCGETKGDVDDGAEVWRLALQSGDGREASAGSEIADEALAEWHKWFAK